MRLLLLLFTIAALVSANTDCNDRMEQLGACFLTTIDHELTIFEEIFEDVSECGLGQTVAESTSRYKAAVEHCKSVTTAMPDDDNCRTCFEVFDGELCQAIFYDQDSHVIEDNHSECEDHCLAKVLQVCPPTSFWMDCDTCNSGFKESGGCDPTTTQQDLEDMFVTAYACALRCDSLHACEMDDEEVVEPGPVPDDWKESVSSSASADTESSPSDSTEQEVSSPNLDQEEETQVGSGPCQGVVSNSGQNKFGGWYDRSIGIASALLAGGSTVGATTNGGVLVKSAKGVAGIGMKASPLGLGIATGMSVSSVVLPMLYSEPNPNDAKIQANKDAIDDLADCVNTELAKIRVDMQNLEDKIQGLYTALSIAHTQEIMYLAGEIDRERDFINKGWKHMNPDGSKSDFEFTDFYEGDIYREFHRITGLVKKLLGNTKSVYSGNYTPDQKKSLAKAIGGLIILYSQYYEDYAVSLTPRGVLLIEEAGNQNTDMLYTKWVEIYNELNAAYNGAPSEYNAINCNAHCRTPNSIQHNAIGDHRCVYQQHCNVPACEYDGGDCMSKDPNISVTSEVRMHLRNAKDLAALQMGAAGWLRHRYYHGKPAAVHRVKTIFPNIGQYTYMTCTPTSATHYQHVFANRGTFSKLIQNVRGLPMLAACLSYITPTGYIKTTSAVVGSDRGPATTYYGGISTLWECSEQCDKQAGCGGFEFGMKMAPVKIDCQVNNHYGGGCYGYGGYGYYGRRNLCRRLEEENSERRSLYSIPYTPPCRTVDPNGNGYIEFPHKGTNPGACTLHFWRGAKPYYFKKSAKHYGRVLYTKASMPRGAAEALEAEVGSKAIMSNESETSTYVIWAGLGIITTIAITRAYYKTDNRASIFTLLSENEL